jgi:hypothetical protein
MEITGKNLPDKIETTWNNYAGESYLAVIPPILQLMSYFKSSSTDLVQALLDEHKHKLPGEFYSPHDFILFSPYSSSKASTSSIR